MHNLMFNKDTATTFGNDFDYLHKIGQGMMGQCGLHPGHCCKSKTICFYKHTTKYRQQERKKVQMFSSSFISRFTR